MPHLMPKDMFAPAPLLLRESVSVTVDALLLGTLSPSFVQLLI